MVVALTVGAIETVIIVFILGGLTVYKFIQPEEVALTAPPVLVPLEPPTINYNQNKTKDRQN